VNEAQQQLAEQSARNLAAEDAEPIAAAFHEAYERLAPRYGYKTREASAVPWAEVPSNNRALMCAVVADLVAAGVITARGLSEDAPAATDEDAPAAYAAYATATGGKTWDGRDMPTWADLGERIQGAWRAAAAAVAGRHE
jgi:hypothetical protein